MHKNKILFFLIFFLFNLFTNDAFAQSCGTNEPKSCPLYRKDYCQYGENIPGEGFQCYLYSCAIGSYHNYTQNCQLDQSGNCLSQDPYSTCVFYYGTNNPPTIKNCTGGTQFNAVICGSSGGGGGSCTAPQGANCTNAGGTCIDTNCSSCNGTIQVGLCPGGSNIRCCIPNPTPTFTPTPTPTNTPTPTPTSTPTPTPTTTPISPWCKYKDASIITNAAINNIIPASPLTPYDSSDPGNRVLIDGDTSNSAGVVGAQSISIGGAQVSATGWDITGTTFSPQFTIQQYIDYIKSKKSSMINEGSIVSGKINILSGNQTISESDLAGKRPLIIIAEGDITLSSTTNILNQANEPQVIMATGTITFPITMTEANGSYIANSVNFGTTANQGLKIIGNLVTETALSCTRQWSDSKKPGVFIVFDPSHYIEMIEMLSTTTYDWRQIQ